MVSYAPDEAASTILMERTYVGADYMAGIAYGKLSRITLLVDHRGISAHRCSRLTIYSRIPHRLRSLPFCAVRARNVARQEDTPKHDPPRIPHRLVHRQLGVWCRATTNTGTHVRQ